MKEMMFGKKDKQEQDAAWKQYHAWQWYQPYQSYQSNRNDLDDLIYRIRKTGKLQLSH